MEQGGDVRAFQIGLLGLAVCVMPLQTMAGKIYRWVDENGTVHYGDKPPAGQQAEQKSYNNVATPFRSTPKDLYVKPPAAEPEVKEAEAEQPDAEGELKTDENTQKDQDSRGSKPRQEPKKLSEKDKPNTTQKKRISDIQKEYQKAKDDYRDKRQGAD